MVGILITRSVQYRVWNIVESWYVFIRLVFQKMLGLHSTDVQIICVLACSCVITEINEGIKLLNSFIVNI